jgi:hypothetical protein
MTDAINLEPAHVAVDPFTTAVNEAAALPSHLDVWTVVEILDYPDHLRVTAGDTELATMDFDDADGLGTSQTAAELGRRARAAYIAGVEPAECA